MSHLDALLLGILQGVTEFLPISSSGHLVIGQEILGMNPEGLKAFDVLVHLGTLLAVLLYFWRDLWGILRVLGGILAGKVAIFGEESRLMWAIIVGTVPAVLAGLFLANLLDKVFESLAMVGLAMLFSAALFWWAERGVMRMNGQNMRIIDNKKAIFIGILQAIALIPGVSRSGSTISAGLLSGLKREEAARFSFLLGVPAILGAGILTVLKYGQEFWNLGTANILIGFFSSFMAGILAISFLMKFLKNNSLKIFGLYLAILGMAVIIWQNFL